MGTGETIERGREGGGGKNTPSRFMPLKPEISAALMGHLARIGNGFPYPVVCGIKGTGKLLWSIQVLSPNSYPRPQPPPLSPTGHDTILSREYPDRLICYYPSRVICLVTGHNIVIWLRAYHDSNKRVEMRKCEKEHRSK